MSKKARNFLGSILAVIVVVILGGCASGTSDSKVGNATPSISQTAATNTASTTPAAKTTVAAAKKIAPKSQLTDEQEQAVGKANDYLAFTNFSKTGLIKQLAYDGFSTKDATVAVNTMKVDYNVQATKKGISYLQLTHFSKAGLIRQLKYDGFTTFQARLGAEGAFAVSQ